MISAKKIGFAGARLDEELDMELNRMCTASGYGRTLILTLALQDFLSGKQKNRKRIEDAIKRRRVAP